MEKSKGAKWEQKERADRDSEGTGKKRKQAKKLLSEKQADEQKETPNETPNEETST